MPVRRRPLSILLLASTLFWWRGAAVAQNPPQAPQTAQQQTPLVPIGSLSLQNASLTEVIDQLARQLSINYILDPRVKGSVYISTYGETRGLDARNLLEMVLRINNAGMVQEGAVFRIVPLTDITRQPMKAELNARDIPDDDQIMLNLVFLKYVTVDELTKVLQQFTGENATILSYSPANLLFILDSRRSMRRTMELISLFDSDTFAGERVRLFEVKNARPSDLVKDLESVLKGISLDGKTSTVRFLPVDRISTLIAVAPNPGVFDTVEDWLKKLDLPVTVTNAVADTYVYHVRYGRADCLAMAIGQLYNPFGPGYGYGGGFGGAYGVAGAAPYGAPGAYGAYAPPISPYGGGGAYGAGFGGVPVGGMGSMSGGYGSQNSFAPGFGGTGGCGAGGFGGGYGYGGYGGYGGGYGGYGYGYPSFGGYSAQTPLTGIPQVPGAAAAPAQAGAAAPNAAATLGATGPQGNPPRVVPNPFDNSLLIQADAAQYQGILKLLKELDVPPRQILLEAKIYQVDMSGDFSSGVTAYFQKKTGTERRPLANLAGGITQFSAGTLVGQSRELLAFLSLQENSSHAHVISEPSLIATDSIPASINVGTQVPVLTSQVATPVQVGGTNAYNQTISSHNTGVTLQVNARINPSGVVTLIVDQEISKPAGGASSLTPSFSQQVVQTQIMLQDGDTIAIGGIIAENGQEASTGIPGLQRLPIIGAVFGSRTYSRTRSEFIIFMTPHVIYDTTDLLEASDELVGRVKKLRKYMR